MSNEEIMYLVDLVEEKRNELEKKYMNETNGVKQVLIHDEIVKHKKIQSMLRGMVEY